MLLTHSDIKKAYKEACKEIKDANKRGQFSISIAKMWTIVAEDSDIALAIEFLDGNGERQTYTYGL